MNNIIIVGAGTVGLELMDRLDNTILIEADPAKYTLLRRQHPDWKVVGGDGAQPDVLMKAGIETANSLILATSKDYVNWKVALSASEFGNIKIVTKIHDESYRQKLLDAGVDHIISPVQETIDAIHEVVFPTTETVTDIMITKESPVLGSKIEDIHLPENCIIAAVRKGQNLRRPNPKMILKEGDILSMVSLGEVDVDIFGSIAGTCSPYLPRSKVVYLMLDTDDMAPFKEVAFLCTRFKVTCEIFIDHHDEELRQEVEEVLEKAGVQGIFKPVSGDILEAFRNYVKEYDADSGVLVALHQARKGMLGHRISLRYIRKLIEATKTTILIARGQRYERVIHLLDSSMVGERCNRCAVSFAQDTSSKLYALCPHDSGSKEHDVVRTHTKRMARIHGIEVVEDIVKGDPTIEFVQKVKAKANQLVVINWNCITLRRDMVHRIINDSEASVLVVGR